MFNTNYASEGAGIGGMIGNGLFNLFGNKNPADAAMPYLDKIPGTISPYYAPYIGAGTNAIGQEQGQFKQLLSNLPNIQTQFNQLTSDPSQIYNKFGAGYQKSPGYQFELQEGLNAANNAAAAGGMLGTPAHQETATSFATNLASKDFNDYLTHILGLYGTGLQGQQSLYGAGLNGVEGLGQLGYNASNDLATNLANVLQSQSNLAYAGQANENQSHGGGLGSIFSGLGALAGFL